MNELIGRTFDGYQVKQYIDAAGRIQNYQAINPQLSRQGLLKSARIWDIHVRNNEWVTTADISAYFRSQAQLVMALGHRHIAAIYGFGRVEDWLYLITDETPGSTLADHIFAGQPYAWRQALAIIKPIAQALAALHERGVAYAEIKPANILLFQADRPILAADFLLLKLPDPAASVMSRAISLEVAAQLTYAAPEQIHEAPPNPRTDVYSLGILLYQLLSGQFPYEGKSDLDFLMTRLTSPPRPLLSANPGAPPDFAPILAKALALDPKQRYQNMAELVQALVAAERKLGATASYSQPPTQPTSSSIAKTLVQAPPKKIDLALKLKQGDERFTLGRQTELLVGRASKTGTSPKPHIDLEAYGGREGGVSRLHSRLSRKGEQWFIEDLGSTNGTFLNGSKLPPHQKIPIHEGDTIAFGRLELEVSIDS